MKKLYSLQLPIALAVAALLSACGGGGAEKPDVASATSASTSIAAEVKPAVWETIDSSTIVASQNSEVSGDANSTTSTTSASTASASTSTAAAPAVAAVDPKVDGYVVAVDGLGESAIAKLKAALEAGQIVALVSTGTTESIQKLDEVAKKVSGVGIAVPSVMLYSGGGKDTGLSLFPLESTNIEGARKEVEAFGKQSSTVKAS